MRWILIALLVLSGCNSSREEPLPLRYDIPEGDAGPEIAAARARLYCDEHKAKTEILREEHDSKGRYLLARCHAG